MATQTNNLLVLNSGVTEKIASTDQVSIDSLALTAASGTALSVTADASIGGDVAVSGDQTVTGTLGVTGSTSLTTLSTSGAATLNSAAVTNGVTVGTTLAVTGAATLSSTLAVTSTSTFSDDVTLSGAGADLSVGGNATVSGTSTLSGAVSAGNTLSVNSTGTFGGQLTVSTGGAAITGNSSITGTLGVTGAADFDSTLNADGNATLGGTLTVTGNVDIGGGDFQVTASTGAVTMNGPGALTVTGTSNLDGGIAVDGTNFTVSGTTGALHTAGDFDVATNKFTVAASTGNTAIAGTLAVTNAGTFASSISADSAAITTTLSAADADFSSTLKVGTSDAFQVANTGNVSTTGTLAVSGGATLSSTLAVTGAATLSSTLGVAGNLDVNSNFAVDAATGNVSTDGTLSVALTSTLTGAVSAGSTLAVAGASTLTGAVTAASTITAAGLITGNAGAAFNGDVDIVGDLTVDGDIVAKNKINLTVQDYFIDLGLGNSSTSEQSGGLTIEMARNAGFTNVWSNLTFTAGVTAVSAPTITAGTAGSALALGDIICVVNADENSGYYVVNSVAGSTITLQGVGGVNPPGSVPFVQNQVETTATGVVAAEAFKCNIGVLAMANGSSNFKDASGAAWPAGTFVTAYAVNATAPYFSGNTAWQSVGQVDLQEAYNTGNSIALADGRNLIVTKPASGFAAIQYQANQSSFYQVAADSGQSLNVGVVPASGGAPQAQINFDDVRASGTYDANLSAEGQINLNANANLFAQSKTGNVNINAVDAGSVVKSQLQLNQDGSAQLLASGGTLTLTAGDAQNILVQSDTIRKADLAGGVTSADGYSLPFAAAIADATLVAVTASGFQAADPTNAPNIMGATLGSAGAGANANVAMQHGALVAITKTGAVSVGQVVYLAPNGQISAAAPTASGAVVMRVGYVAARAGQPAPIVYFAPQFIAKLL
jgi:hypothetical protein